MNAVIKMQEILMRMSDLAPSEMRIIADAPAIYSVNGVWRELERSTLSSGELREIIGTLFEEESTAEVGMKVKSGSYQARRPKPSEWSLHWRFRPLDEISRRDTFAR